MTSESSRTSRARDMLVLAVACTAVYLVSAGHPVLGSSARYYEAAREMRQLGAWSVPHLQYTPYGEKPPLVYWLGAIARSFGSGPRAASLPSLLATIVALWSTWALGVAIGSRALGLGAALFLLGTTFVQAMAGVLIPDTILTATTAIAWWTFWEWERSERTTWRRLIAFYASIGVGWMTKGPVALLLPAVGIALYTLLTDGWTGPFRCLWRMRPLIGLAIVVAINLPWTLMWWHRDPRLLEFFYLRINLDSFLHGNYNHLRSWWYYGPVLIGSLIPFVLFALPVLAAQWWLDLRHIRGRAHGSVDSADRAHRYLTGCTLGPLLLLSASSAKLGTYLMPIIPPVALLLAMRIAQWRRTPWWIKAVAAAQTAILLTAVVIVAIKVPAAIRTHRVVLFGNELIGAREAASIDFGQAWIALVVVAAMFLGSLGFFVCAARDRLRAGLAVLAIGFSIGTSVLLGTMDRLVPRWDSSSLVMDLRARGGDDRTRPQEERDPVLVDRSVAQDYVIPLTLGRRVGIVDRAQESGLGHFLQAHPDPSVPMPGPGQPIKHPYDVSGENTEHDWLWSRERLRDAWNGNQRVWLFIRERAIRDLELQGLSVNRISSVEETWLVSNQP
jgi:4-amino-4-deoxy-L-arabinose transferase-like glycosyltransferase